MLLWTHLIEYMIKRESLELYVRYYADIRQVQIFIKSLDKFLPVGRECFSFQDGELNINDELLEDDMHRHGWLMFQEGGYTSTDERKKCWREVVCDQVS